MNKEMSNYFKFNQTQPTQHLPMHQLSPVVKGVLGLHADRARDWGFKSLFSPCPSSAVVYGYTPRLQHNGSYYCPSYRRVRVSQVLGSREPMGSCCAMPTVLRKSGIEQLSPCTQNAQSLSSVWCDMVHDCMVYIECAKMAAVSPGTRHVTTKQWCKYIIGCVIKS